MNKPEHPLLQAYRAFSPASVDRAARAQSVFPGGDNRSSGQYGISADPARGHRGQRHHAESDATVQPKPGATGHARKHLLRQCTDHGCRTGVMSATRLMYCISTPMGEAEVDQAIDALSASVAELLPFIQQERPNLLAA